MARGARTNKSVERQNYQRRTSQSQRTYRDSYPAEKKQTKKPKKRGMKKKKLPKVKYVYSDIPGTKISVSIYFNIALIFLCALATSISFANVSLQRNYNQRLTSQLRTMERATEELGLQVLETRNLEEIEHLARTRLGMSEPSPHQIVYIIVDTSPTIIDSYVEYLEDSLHEESLGERIVYIFGNIVEFLLGR